MSRRVGSRARLKAARKRKKPAKTAAGAKGKKPARWRAPED